MFKRQKLCTEEEDGWTQLHIAALKGNAHLCASILESAANPWTLVFEKTHKSKSTVLHCAVLGGYIQCIHCIISHLVGEISPPADVLTILTYQSCPIRLPSCIFVHVSEKSLAESFGPDEVVSSPRRTGFSALDFAVITDNTCATTMLLDAMHWAYSRVVSVPSPYAIRNHIGNDILQVAIAKGNDEIVTALLDRGACLEVETDDERGMRPIHWAVAFGRVQIIRSLLQRGADPLSTTAVSQETVQDIAMQSLGNSREIFEMFDQRMNEL